MKLQRTALRSPARRPTDDASDQQSNVNVPDGHLHCRHGENTALSIEFINEITFDFTLS